MVADHQIRWRREDAVERLRAVSGGDHVEARLPQRQLEDAEAARIGIREEESGLRHDGRDRLPRRRALSTYDFLLPNSRPERTPPPVFCCFPRRCSISRSSSAASGWWGSSSSALRNASTAESGSLVRQSTPAT